MSLRERITKRSGVILSKQSLHFESEIASLDSSGPNKAPSRMTDHAGRFILLAMTLRLLVFTSALFVLPSVLCAQLTRVDSLLASSLVPMLPSINGNSALMTGDTIFAPLFAAMQKPTSTGAPLFYVSQLSANVQREDSGKARMDISMQGELIQPMSSLAINRTLARTVDLQLTDNDWNALQNNTDRYVHSSSPQSGFWSNTLEPVLVVLGAVAVVALFFLIRS
jgi:hypothetical protein